MSTGRKRAGLAFAIGLWTTQAAAQDIPGRQFSVHNNTAINLRCEFRVADGEWRAFDMAPGSEWNQSVDDERAMAHARCQPPVKRVVYRLNTATRYALLRNNSGATVKLRRVGTQ